MTEKGWDGAVLRVSIPRHPGAIHYPPPPAMQRADWPDVGPEAVWDVTGAQWNGIVVGTIGQVGELLRRQQAILEARRVRDGIAREEWNRLMGDLNDELGAG